MPKTKTKTKTPARKPFAADVERQREAAILRRSRALQKRVVDLSRAVTRAVRQADGARLTAARELCADTGFGVFGVDEVKQAQLAVEIMRDTINKLEARITELEHAAVAAGV